MAVDSIALRKQLEVLALRMLRAGLRPLPLRWVALPGMCLGWFLFSVLRFRRALILDNLRLAFGDALSPAARRSLARRCYVFFGGLICEVLSHPRISQARLDGFVTFTNLDVLDRALLARKGVVMVTGHFGSWELIGTGLAARGYDFSAYVGQQGNAATDDMLNAIRRSGGIGTIPKGTASRGMLRTLRSNGVLGIVSDQHFSRSTHFIHFFGQRISVAPGAASMALRTGARMIFAASVPKGRFRYEVHLQEIPCQPSGDVERDVLEMSQAFADMLEAQVRRHPGYYFWLHRRWRSPPPGLRLSAQNQAFLRRREEPGEAPPVAS